MANKKFIRRTGKGRHRKRTPKKSIKAISTRITKLSREIKSDIRYVDSAENTIGPLGPYSSATNGNGQVYNLWQ